MRGRDGYQISGNKLSTSVGWGVVILWMAILWLWKPLPLSMVMELVLAWLWFMGIVAFVILVGRLVRGRQNDWFSSRPYRLQDRRLPTYLDSFHQRYQQRHLRFKRTSPLD